MYMVILYAILLELSTKNNTMMIMTVWRKQNNFVVQFTASEIRAEWVKSFMFSRRAGYGLYVHKPH